ncbi:MAG: TadE/TadG family type IV pilus assembly protein [Pseudomonadota bacterium]
MNGATAVEFALILPIMVLLYMSTVEISHAISVQRKVAIVAGTLGDLAAQQETVNDSLLDLIFASSQATILPYSSTPLKAVLSSVRITSGGNEEVIWSYAWQNGSKTMNASPGDTFNVPNDLKVPNTSVIVAQITYDYTSPIEFIFPTSRSLTSQLFFRPRLGSEITFQASAVSATWSLPTSGTPGTQIGTNYVGFGAEYSAAVRPVDRDGNGVNESPPFELQNAQNCYYYGQAAPQCQPGPGNNGDPGGGGGSGCQNYSNPFLSSEIYNVPMSCYRQDKADGRF